MGSNSADRRRGGPVGSADEVETTADVASPAVVVEEPGFAGGILGQEPRIFLTIADGEPLTLALTSAISTETAMSGDTFTTTLAKAVLVDEREALPQGTELWGHIAHAQRSDKVKGRAELTLELDASSSEMAKNFSSKRSRCASKPNRQLGKTSPKSAVRRGLARSLAPSSEARKAPQSVRVSALAPELAWCCRQEAKN